MIPDHALDLAVERGIISADQAFGLRVLARDLPADPGETGLAWQQQRTDDETLRFISGFADIFVTIGIGLFTGALFYLVHDLIGPATALWSLTVATWLLAEFFTRRRRMALPSIALLVTFAVSAMAGLLWSLTIIAPSPDVPHPRLDTLPRAEGVVILMVGLGTAALVALHYWRFRVPITIAAGMAALLVTLLGFVAAIVPESPAKLYYGIAVFWGGLSFALAMRFDFSDPKRVTRRSDIAFWLHLLAAPLIVHALVHGFFPEFTGQPTLLAAIVVLAAFLALGLIALVIDRRAILVSGLVYAGIAFGTVIRNFGLGNVGLLIPIVALLLGAFILLLSAGWQPLRRLALGLLPADLAQRLPHPMVSVPL